jgi:uncharacterized protein YndB with AHSA1/START domain
MTSDRSGAERIQVSLQSEGGVGAVRIECRVDAVGEEVWSALTDPVRLANWYGEIDGDLRVGGEFSARLFASGWEGTGRIEACEPLKRLVTVSRDPDVPFDDSTEVRLRGDGDQTTVVVEQHGIPLNMLWAYGAGLQIHVEDLAGHIAGHERPDSEPRFEALKPRYEALAADIT